MRSRSVDGRRGREAAARDAPPWGRPPSSFARAWSASSPSWKIPLKAKPAARRTALRTAASDIFDFTEITRRSLGRHWQTASQTERDDLVSLMTALLERSYLSRIEQYSGERIVFAGETAEPDLATVRTRLVSKGGIETPVDYRLYRAGDRWMVYDVTVEGVSLVANYRAQFNKIIQTSSAQGLVEKVRAKQE